MRTIHAVCLVSLALTAGACKEPDVQGCIDEIAGGPMSIATSRDECFQGKVRESTARCRGGDVALRFLTQPWLDWTSSSRVRSPRLQRTRSPVISPCRPSSGSSGNRPA